MGAPIDVADVVGWVIAGAVFLALIWAANYRSRIHQLLREGTPEALVRAARRLWRAKLALFAALEA